MDTVAINAYGRGTRNNYNDYKLWPIILSNVSYNKEELIIVNRTMAKIA